MREGCGHKWVNLNHSVLCWGLVSCLPRRDSTLQHRWKYQESHVHRVSRGITPLELYSHQFRIFWPQDQKMPTQTSRAVTYHQRQPQWYHFREMSCLDHQRKRISYFPSIMASSSWSFSWECLLGPELSNTAECSEDRVGDFSGCRNRYARFACSYRSIEEMQSDVTLAFSWWMFAFPLIFLNSLLWVPVELSNCIYVLHHFCSCGEENRFLEVLYIQRQVLGRGTDPPHWMLHQCLSPPFPSSVTSQALKCHIGGKMH